MMTIQLPERCYCADVVREHFCFTSFNDGVKICSALLATSMWCLLQMYPMAVVGTAGRGLIIYQLENQPQEFKRVDSPLKYQVGLLPERKNCTGSF